MPYINDSDALISHGYDDWGADRFVDSLQKLSEYWQCAPVPLDQEKLFNNFLKYIDELPLNRFDLLVGRSSDEEKYLAFIINFIAVNYLNQLTPSLLGKLLLLACRYADNKQIARVHQYIKYERKPLNEELCNFGNESVSKFILNFDLVERKFHRFYHPEKKLKIAVCISGQIRGFDKAFKTWGKLGLDTHFVDYYIHAWDKSGRRFPDNKKAANRVFRKSFGSTYFKIYKEFGYGFLSDQYPSLTKLLEAKIKIDVPALKRCCESANICLENDEADFFKDFTNQQKMLYGISRSFEMINESEVNTYDLVVRMRPDKIVKEPLAPEFWHECAEIVNNSPIVLGYGHTFWFNEGGVAIGDQFFIASPATYRVLANTFHDQIHRGPTHKLSSHQHEGFVALGRQLIESGILAKRAPIQFGGFADPPKISQRNLLNAVNSDISTRGIKTDVDVRLLDALKVADQESLVNEADNS